MTIKSSRVFATPASSSLTSRILIFSSAELPRAETSQIQIPRHRSRANHSTHLSLDTAIWIWILPSISKRFSSNCLIGSYAANSTHKTMRRRRHAMRYAVFRKKRSRQKCKARAWAVGCGPLLIKHISSGYSQAIKKMMAECLLPTSSYNSYTADVFNTPNRSRTEAICQRWAMIDFLVHQFVFEGPWRILCWWCKITPYPTAT